MIDSLSLEEKELVKPYFLSISIKNLAMKKILCVKYLHVATLNYNNY